MLKNQSINLKVVEKVASALGELNNEVIYVGGAVVSLYVTDQGAEQPRPTKDIDISVQISSYSQMDILREKLANKKIYPASSEMVMYRYSYEDILIDFIPFEETPLGPTNSWLKPGFKKAYPVKIGKIDILEKDLRKLIQLKPDHAHAHNALGYSFAEHGNRLPEALELIEKAIKLSPEDPYIIDSLGWVHYRMGNLNKGVSYLKQAFVIKPDPEIAAHLGEVLWMQGTKEEAKEVWRSTIKSHPDNEVLLNTMKKFMP